MTSSRRRRAAVVAGAAVGLVAFAVLTVRLWPAPAPQASLPATLPLGVGPAVSPPPGTLPPLTASPDWAQQRPADTETGALPGLPSAITTLADGPRPPDTDPFQHVETAEGIVPPDTDPVSAPADEALPPVITAPGDTSRPPPDTDPHAGRPHAVNDPNPLTARGGPPPRDTYPFAQHPIEDPDPATARGEVVPDTN